MELAATVLSANLVLIAPTQHGTFARRSTTKDEAVGDALGLVRHLRRAVHRSTYAMRDAAEGWLSVYVSRDPEVQAHALGHQTMRLPSNRCFAIETGRRDRAGEPSIAYSDQPRPQG